MKNRNLRCKSTLMKKKFMKRRLPIELWNQEVKFNLINKKFNS